MIEDKIERSWSEGGACDYRLRSTIIVDVNGMARWVKILVFGNSIGMTEMSHHSLSPREERAKLNEEQSCDNIEEFGPKNQAKKEGVGKSFRRRGPFVLGFGHSALYKNPP